MGPRSAETPPPYSSAPPRPPDLDEVRRKRIQIAREQAAEQAAVWRREFEKTIASFRSELLNELRQFRSELTAQVMEPSRPTSAGPVRSLPVTQPVSSELHFGTIDSYKPPPPLPATADLPPPATAGLYPYQLQQPPPPPPRPSITVHALAESPSPVHMRYTYHSLSNGDFNKNRNQKQQHFSLNDDCGALSPVSVAKLTGIDEKLDMGEGESLDTIAEVNSGDGRVFNQLESVTIKQDDQGPTLCGKIMEYHSLYMFDKMLQSDGMCNAGRTIIVPMSIRDKGGGLTTHREVVDASDEMAICSVSAKQDDDGFVEGKKQVPKLSVEALMVSVIPGDVGKPTVKLDKVVVRDGSCRWENLVYETVKFDREPRTGKSKERLYSFVLSTGSSKASVLGEISVDFAEYSEATKASSVSLPLKNSSAVLQKLQENSDQREVEGCEDAKVKSQDNNLKIHLSNNDADESVLVDKMTNWTTQNAECNHTTSIGLDITLSSSDNSSGLDTSRELVLRNIIICHDPSNYLSSPNQLSIPHRPEVYGSTNNEQKQSQWEWSADYENGVQEPRNAELNPRKDTESSYLRQELENNHKKHKFKEMLKARAALPIAGLKGDILQLLQDNNVQVVCGETGSGKTTQVPQFILDDMIQSGRGGPCNIICTQPWRIAAISVADRVADERCEPSPGSNGSLVGYQVRLHSASNEKTKLLFCTTGIRLRKFVGDRNLTGITHVIVDEVHKRSLLGGYLLIVLKNLIEIGNPYALLLAQKMGEKVDVLFFLVPRWAAAYIPICLSCKVVKCITAVIAIPVILVCAVFLTAVYVRYKLRDCRCAEIDLKSTKNGRSGSLFQKDLGKIHHVASIMVARDVASREFDITHVAQVVNFDFSKIIDDYFHKIGHPGMVVEFIKESKKEVPNWLINHAQQSLYYGGGQSQGYICLLNHRMEFLCMPHSEIAIFWIWLPTPPLRLKVWVLNRHGLIVIKAQMLIGDAFLKIELMFDNESHIIPTGAIVIRLVCHFGTDLQVTNSYSHMDHSEMCWLHTWLICCLLFCDCKKKALPLTGKGKLKEMAALFNWFLCASSEFATLATLNAWLNGNFLFLRLENKLQKMKLVLADKLKKLDTIVKMMFVDNWESWKYLILAADVKAIAARISYGGLSKLVASEYFSCSVGPIIAREMGVYGYKPSVLVDMLAGWLHVALRDKELIKANST